MCRRLRVQLTESEQRLPEATPVNFNYQYLGKGEENRATTSEPQRSINGDIYRT